MANGLQLAAVLAALTEDASPDDAATFLLSYNASTKEANKVKLQTILEAIGNSGGSWGNLNGNLSDQTDLQNALDSKVPTSRTITTGAGLTGGGNLTANRTLALDINGLTEEATAANGDFIPIYDLSSGTIKKMSRENFLAGIGAGSPMVITANNATEIPVTIQLASGQSVNGFQILPFGSSTPLFRIDQSGNINFSGRMYGSGSGNYVSWGDIAYGDVEGSGNSNINYNGVKAVRFRDNSGNITFQVNNDNTAGAARLFLWDITAGTLKQVSFGANDSGGAGFKFLRVAN